MVKTVQMWGDMSVIVCVLSIIQMLMVFLGDSIVPP